MRVCPRCRSIFTGEGEFCSLDGQQLVEWDGDPLIGERIDRYEFVERLGTGAMGVVYRVRHTELDRDFAIKVLYGEFGSNKSLVARFRREAKAMSRMGHPNVVSVVDFGTTEHGLNFLVMNLIEGRTLEALLEERRTLAPEHAAWIARQIAAGLGEAHRLGFVHRDVKPANVMLSGIDGREHVKVLDFGIVGVTDEAQSTKLTGTGRIVGTPRYMSPEQARDANVDPPADLYSLGVILYEMLSGDVPFPGDILADVLVLHSTADHDPLPRSEGLEYIVDALLAKRFEDRIQTAAEVIMRLDACFDDLAPSFPSVIEDEIPTERPRAVSDPRRAPTVVIDRENDLEIPALADDAEPLIPFPHSDSSLEALHEEHAEETSDVSIYDSAPAAFEDGALRGPRETSGFDRPGAAALDAITAAPPIVDQTAMPTFGGISDDLLAPEPPRKRLGGFLVVLGVLSLVGLGIVVARPEIAESQKPPPVVVAPSAEPFAAPVLESLEFDEHPVVADVDAPTTKKRRVRRKKTTTTETEAPRLSVPELEVALGHVLARRGLDLTDLDALKSTRGLARAWRTARKDQTEAEAAATLGSLIAATRTARLTRRLLIRKARRVRRHLDDARPALPPDEFGTLDKILRAHEFESKKVARGEFDRVAGALTKLELRLAARLSSP